MSRSKSKASPWELHNRPAAPALTILLVCALACALAWFWQFRVSVPEDTAAPAGVQSSVRLNELMSSNKSALTDNRGEYSDWIELMNTSDHAVDITGWKLSDGGSIFTFPKHVLAPGEAVLVYASGSIHAIPGEVYHAPFRLSASGETVTLTDDFEIPADTVTLPPLDPNTSYARTDTGEWQETQSFTPGLANDQPYTPVERVSSVAGLVISEIMPKNVSYAADQDGDFSDYIELYNGSGAPVSLKGFMLSDNSAKPDKWLFPDITLEAGQYLIVYASGKDRTEGELHTNFSLNADEETLFLSDCSGLPVCSMSYAGALPDISWSGKNGEWVTSLAPTPGFSNDETGAAQTDALLLANNASQIYISEVMSSTRVVDEDTETSYDWIELYNASNSPVDLSGWGLSDSASRPRKWQFPEGASIAPGQYLLVFASGKNTFENGAYHTSFSLSRSEGEALVLCRPDGTVVDRIPAGQRYAEISCGRVQGQSGLFLFAEATPGAANSAVSYAGRAQQVLFSEEGGVKTDSFTLTLTAGEGETIYYTTDCTDPTSASTRYTGPIEISATTVVRAVAVKDGWLDSISSTHTYLFGVSHTLPVFSLVADPDDMFSEENGLYTNYEELWERDAHIEYFTTDGQTLFSQGAAISLHGNDARECEQKTFNVIARSEYGDNRFRASIFPNRDYTEYQSFLLRPSSEDSNYSRMRCSILSSLLESETNVLYQDVVVGVLYINGEYWGHYNLRERVNTHAIAQFEGWTAPDRIDLVKGNSTVKQGSNQTFNDLLRWLEDNSLEDNANVEYVNTIVDIENYLDYVMLQMYVSNSDLLNVKRYRSDEGDGRWKWVVFDLDWAFYNDTNSWKDWLGEDGCGLKDATDNTLFRSLMENENVREYFLRLLGERLATVWSSDVLTQKIDERKALLDPEMPATYARWNNSLSRWEEKVADLRAYALSRPAKLIGYIADYENMTEAEIEDYFGEALRANPAP